MQIITGTKYDTLFSYSTQLDVDGLPIWAKVGDLDISDEKFEEMERAGVRFEMRVNAQHSHDVMPENSLLYTHRHFTFGVNNDQIVEVNMTASDPQLVHVNEYRGSSPISR